MATRAQKIRLSIFFIVIVGLFTIFIFAVIGTTLWEDKDIYYIEYSNTSVSGLQVGGTVIYQGINVGTVESVQIDPENVENIIVTISIQEGTPIKEDVRAKLVPVGITGITQIELAGGTQEADTLEPGSYIQPGPSTMTAVTESVQNVLSDIETLLADISKVIKLENREKIENIIDNIDDLLVDNRYKISSILGNIDKTTESLAGSADSAELMIKGLDEQIGALNLSEMNDRFEGIADETEQLVSRLDLILLRRQDDISESIEMLNDTIRLLNNFAFRISENPALLFLGEEGP